MQILVTGATGSIGRPLIKRLLLAGHRVTAWVRGEVRARQSLGADVALYSDAQGADALEQAVAAAEVVVNLAGENVAAERWSAKRKVVLRASRIDLTRRIVAAMALPQRPRALINASAVGYYGDGGDATFTETSQGADDFLALLCRDWEEAAEAASEYGVRVVRLRIGVVFSPEGGALEKMVPLFRVGLGGRIGSGDQVMSWIHLDDLLAIITRAIDDESLRGAINAVAPEPVRSKDLARALGKALGRPAVLPAPAFALKIAFGEMASTLLASCRVRPARLEELGFVFAFPTVEQALDDLLR